MLDLALLCRPWRSSLHALPTVFIWFMNLDLKNAIRRSNIKRLQSSTRWLALKETWVALALYSPPQYSHPMECNILIFKQSDCEILLDILVVSPTLRRIKRIKAVGGCVVGRLPGRKSGTIRIKWHGGEFIIKTASIESYAVEEVCWCKWLSICITFLYFWKITATETSFVAVIAFCLRSADPQVGDGPAETKLPDGVVKNTL